MADDIINGLYHSYLGPAQWEVCNNQLCKWLIIIVCLCVWVGACLCSVNRLIDYFLEESPATSIAFSPTGDFLATSHVDDLGIYLWLDLLPVGVV